MQRGWLDLPALNAAREPFDRRSAYAYLVEKAFWTPGPFTVEGVELHLERGQYAASFRYLARAWNWPASKVQRFLNRLKTDTLIDTAADTGRLVITICNYSEIQRARGLGDTPSDTASKRNRYESKASPINRGAPAYSDSPEGVQGEEREGRAGKRCREWSPKTDDPRQCDLEEAIRAAEQREAAAIPPAPATDPEPEPVKLQAPAPAKPVQAAPLPLELSLEGEVVPAEPELPLEGEVLPPERSPPVIRNVVKFKPKTAPENDPDFLEWYATYPRKKKPIDAAKAYAEARRSATPAELLAGALRCREEAAAKPSHERRYVPYPASWLRAGGWMDEHENHFSEESNHGRNDHRREERGPNALPGAIANILARRARNA